MNKRQWIVCLVVCGIGYGWAILQFAGRLPLDGSVTAILTIAFKVTFIELSLLRNGNTYE